MPKSSAHNEFLPPQALQSVKAVGEGLALARLRRKESLRDWALRMGVAVRTVQRMEKGDPGVGMGIYALAIWLMGRSQALADVSAPEHDMTALDLELQSLRRRKT
jgi:hypothetical protein